MEQDENKNIPEQGQEGVEKTKRPIRISRKKLLLSRKMLNETETILGQLQQCDDEDLKAIYEAVLNEVKLTMELESDWLDEVYMFRDPIKEDGEEGKYDFRYDIDNLHGRKTIVEVNKEGKITRTITFKEQSTIDMYCPNCREHHKGKFCPKCGERLVENTVGVNLSFGNAHANNGNVNVD